MTCSSIRHTPISSKCTSANKIGTLAPPQFGGLSYRILEEKGGDIYVIQTESFGRCAIWAPRDNDSTLTTSTTYTNGDSSGGESGGSGGNGGDSGDGGVIIPGGLKVFIDPGHGGSDPGAVGNGLNEKDIVLAISKKLGVALNSKGVSIKYARTTDEYVSLKLRSEQANAWGANLFVSIHANAAKAISNKLGIKPYSLNHIKLSHSETIYKTNNLEINLGAELIQDEPAIALSTENAKKLASMGNPQKIFEGATGILLDMLPSAVTTELEIMLNGLEKIELSSGKVSFNIFTQELKVQGVEIATILKFSEKARVKESLSLDYTFDFTDLITGGLSVALLVLLITILTPVVGDEILAIIVFFANVFHKIFT